jgi:hypothetical protein
MSRIEEVSRTGTGTGSTGSRRGRRGVWSEKHHRYFASTEEVGDWDEYEAMDIEEIRKRNEVNRLAREAEKMKRMEYVIEAIPAGRRVKEEKTVESYGPVTYGVDWDWETELRTWQKPVVEAAEEAAAEVVKEVVVKEEVVERPRPDSPALLRIDPLLERGDLTWAEAAEDDESARDAPFVAMTDAEFEEERMAAKRERRFASWEDWVTWVRRIQARRQRTKAMSEPAPLRERSMLTVLLRLREDYRRNPNMYFHTKKEADQEMYKIDEEIARETGGAYRLRIVYEEEKREAAPMLDALVSTIRRRAAALQTCRRILAGKKILAFLRTL